MQQLDRVGDRYASANESGELPGEKDQIGGADLEEGWERPVHDAPAALRGPDRDDLESLVLQDPVNRRGGIARCSLLFEDPARRIGAVDKLADGAPLPSVDH